MKLFRSSEELANATAVRPDSAADGDSSPMMVMNTVNTVAMSAGPVE
jgi:hypothetical protein